MRDVDTTPSGQDTVGSGGSDCLPLSGESRIGLRSGVDEQRARIQAAKLSLPHQGFALSRPRLRGMLEPLTKSGGVIFVVGGPGFGKTGLIVDLLSTSDARTAYYAVDESDRDPVRFLTRFMSGLGFEPSLRVSTTTAGWAGADAGIEALDLAAELIDSMNRRGSERVLVAVDDLHLLEDSDVAVAALDLVLRSLPPEWTMLLSSRRGMPFELDALRLSGRLVELRSRDLRLTPIEVTEWVRKNWGVALQPSEARALWQLTEGWPAGLSLLGQQLRSRNVPIKRRDVVRAVTSGEGLRSYLERDVLSSLDSFAREVVLTAAVLPRVVFPRDETLLPGEMGRAEAVLSDLVSRGFLVSRIGARIFSIHPLVRAFAERRAERSQCETELTWRAAQHLEHHGEMREAVSLYLRAGRVQAAIGPLRAVALSSLNAAAAVVRDEWFEQLSDQAPADEPWLLLTKARILQKRRTYSEAEAVYSKAVGLAASGQCKESLLPSLLGSAFCLFNLGRWEESLGALARCDKLAFSPRERTEVLASTGNVLLSMCRWDESVARWEAALAIAPDELRRPTETRVCCYRSRLFFLRGDYKRAKEWAKRALSLSREGPGLIHTMVLNGVSLTCAITGDYEAAQRYANETLRLVRARGYDIFEMSALHNQAAADLGGWNYRQAFLKIKEAERLARRAGDAEEIVWAEDMLGDLCRRNKNPQQAIEHHSQALGLLDDRCLSVFERARATCAIGMDQAVAGRDSEAQRTLEEAARLSRQWSLVGSLSPSLFYLGWLHAKAGREQAAVRFLVEAMKLASDNEHVFFYSQEARVATPILALCDRVGAGAFIRQRVLPTLPSRLQDYFFELAEGARYPTDSTLGPPKKGRLGLGDRENRAEVEVDEAILGRIATLTEREREVLKMVALGMSNKKIGSELFITEKTVKTHTNHIFRKLGVSSRMQATFALQGYQRARIKALQNRNRQPGTR